MRAGHRRPVGTIARVRMYDMPCEPKLGSLCFDAPIERCRAYEIVGVEEVARPGRWNLLLERMDWDDFIWDPRPVAFSIVPRS